MPLPPLALHSLHTCGAPRLVDITIIPARMEFILQMEGIEQYIERMSKYKSTDEATTLNDRLDKLRGA